MFAISTVRYTLLCNDCVEGLAVGILAVILLTTMFVLCLIYFRRRSVMTAFSVRVVLFFTYGCYKPFFLDFFHKVFVSENVDRTLHTYLLKLIQNSSHCFFF